MTADCGSLATSNSGKSNLLPPLSHLAWPFLLSYTNCGFLLSAMLVARLTQPAVHQIYFNGHYNDYDSYNRKLSIFVIKKSSDM